MIDIYRILRRLIQIRYVGRCSYKSIVILILRHCSILDAWIRELIWILTTLSPSILDIAHLIGSNRASNYRLVLHCALNFMWCTANNSGGSLRLSGICWLGSWLQFLDINGTGLLPWSLSTTIVLDRRCCLSYMISFAHECILALILLILSIILIIIIIFDRILVFESLLLILIVYLILNLYILLRAYLLTAWYLHLLMWLTTSRFLNKKLILWIQNG